MVARIIKFIGLISVAVSNRSPIVEAAERAANGDSVVEHRLPGESSVIRLPPDIVIPLPFVYPEYNDPREDVASAVEPDRQKTDESVGDAILENVRHTMLVSSLQELEVPILNNYESTRTTVRRTNRHRSSPMRSGRGNETPAASEINNVTISKDNSEKEPSFKSSLKFGARLRTSHASSENEFVKMRNPTRDSVDVDGSRCNDSEGMCQSTSLVSRGKSHSRRRAEISPRRRSASTVGFTVPRRRRPNVVDSKEIKSDAGVTAIPVKSREVERDRE